MTRKTPYTVILRESLASSIASDAITFAMTASLILIADGRSMAWQIITIAMFVLWVTARAGGLGKIQKFYSKRELVEWVNSLPEDKTTTTP